MPTPTERTALTFLAGVLCVGAGVRAARALTDGTAPPPAAAIALQQQQRVVDSARMIRKSTPVSPPPRRARIARPPAPVIRYPIDVDRADSTLLDALPGVGPSLAQRILADRRTHGPFGSLTELGRRVRGVGPAMLARIDSLVTFSGTTGGRSP